jgi:enoyl-CoA hydratase
VIHAALIPAMIGASRAAWLLLTGETIDAGTAASWGLVHDMVPDDKLDARITQLAALCRAKTPAWALTWRFAPARLLCGIR